MLPRVLESEAMDTLDEAEDYDAMDHGGVNARFVADFLQVHGPCRGGTVLDVGTGPGQIPILLCQADQGSKVLGVDLAAAMIEQAQKNVKSANLADRIRLELGDAKGLESLPSGGFEGVLSNSIVHHIPDPAPALAEMVRLVSPGGTLFVRDLFRPDDLNTLAQLVSTHAGSEPPAARALFEASLHAALTLDEVRTMIEGLGLPPEGVSLTSDRHWTWVWQRRIEGC